MMARQRSSLPWRVFSITLHLGEPACPQVQAYLSGGSAPTFTCHRFWAQVDIATAYDVYGWLFP
jgi:hypothetical protein